MLRLERPRRGRRVVGLALAALALAVPASASAADLTWTGAENANWSTGPAMNFAHSRDFPSPASFKNGDSVIFGGETDVYPVTIEGDVTPSSVAAFPWSRRIVLGGSGRITGSGRLTQFGPGELAIENANAYSGGTTLYRGVLALGSDSALGTGPLRIRTVLTSDGVAALEAYNGARTVTNDVSIENSKEVGFDGSRLTFTRPVGFQASADPYKLRVRNHTVFAAGASGAAKFDQLGSGILELRGPVAPAPSIFGGELRLDDATLATGLEIFFNARLTGEGSVASKLVVAGIVDPGDPDLEGGTSTGRIEAGSLEFFAGGFLVDIPTDGPSDQLVVRGGLVDLRGLDLGVRAQEVTPGASYTIIVNEGGMLIPSAEIPEGTVFIFPRQNGGRVELRLTYQGGDGDDVALKVISVEELPRCEITIGGPPVCL